MAGSSHIPQVGSPIGYSTLSPVVDTSAYAAGDVLFEAVEVTDLLRSVDGFGRLDSIVVIDKADQGVAINLWFFDADVDVGDVNTAFALADADAANILTVIPIATGDYVDGGGFKVAPVDPGSRAKILKAVSGERSIFMAGSTSGTPTFGAATDLLIRLGVLQG